MAVVAGKIAEVRLFDCAENVVVAEMRPTALPSGTMIGARTDHRHDPTRGGEGRRNLRNNPNAFSLAANPLPGDGVE